MKQTHALAYTFKDFNVLAHILMLIIYNT